MAEATADLETFKAWPKIPRDLELVMHITEKVDGTNAQVVVLPDGRVLAASRSRFVVPGDDNYGFAAWVEAHKDDLRGLGVGRHYGEWYGVGIQRQYGLFERRFALFSKRSDSVVPEYVGIVPTLYHGTYKRETISEIHAQLVAEGSRLVPGFMRPEGVVIHLPAVQARFKITDLPRGGKGA